MNGKASNIDLTLMFPGVLITLLVGILLTIFPVQGKAIVDSLFGILTHNFKWAFLVFGLFCVLFLIWLAFSRWGDIKLGRPVVYYLGPFCSRLIVNRPAQSGTALVDCCCTATHTGAAGDGLLPDEVD